MPFLTKTAKNLKHGMFFCSHTYTNTLDSCENTCGQSEANEYTVIVLFSNWKEHGASMVGELFSGGVCQKENGENCSAEAGMDGRLTKVG